MRDISNVLKYMQKTDNGFYGPEHIISYNRPANIITGHRSGGKSTGVARFNLFDAILNDSRFIYMRRTKDELDKTKIHFFDQAIDIINRAKLGFKIVYFDCIAGDYMCTWIKDGDSDLSEDEAKECAKKIGSTMALSLSQKVKSGYDFTNVNNIIYDEFIAEHQTGYLGSYENPDVEYTNLISIYVSCDRGIDKYFRNETRMFLIGNMANIYNPILLKWGVNKYLRMSPDANIIAPKGMPWVLENVEPSEAFKEQAVTHMHML